MISAFCLLLLIASNVKINLAKPSTDQLSPSNGKDEQVLAKNSSAATSDAGSSLSKEAKTNLHRAHGILMLLAWLLFITIAIISARYLRGYDKSWGGTQVWFLMHRTLNLIGVALIVAGFLCIFISENWTWKGPKVNGGDKNWEASAIHSLVGLLCIILAWIQSLVTFVRPSPSSAIRRLFNWVHRSTGVVAFILAAATIIIAGIGINRWSNRQVALALIIAFMVCLFVAVGLGEMTIFLEKMRSTQTVSITPPQNNKLDSNSKANRQISSYQTRLRLIFGVFGCIAVAIAVTLSFLVALSGD